MTLACVHVRVEASTFCCQFGVGAVALKLNFSVFGVIGMFFGRKNGTVTIGQMLQLYLQNVPQKADLFFSSSGVNREEYCLPCMFYVSKFMYLLSS